MKKATILLSLILGINTTARANFSCPSPKVIQEAAARILTQHSKGFDRATPDGYNLTASEFSSSPNKYITLEEHGYTCQYYIKGRRNEPIYALTFSPNEPK